MSIKPLVLSGSDYEIGFRQGQSNREAIHRGIEEVFGLEQVLQSKPKLLPKSLFMILARALYGRHLHLSQVQIHPGHFGPKAIQNKPVVLQV